MNDLYENELSADNPDEEPTPDNKPSFIQIIIINILQLIAIRRFKMNIMPVTMKWLVHRIKEKFRKEEVSKVAVCDIQTMLNSNINAVSMHELLNKGYTHIIAEVNSSGKVIDIELLRDSNDVPDEQVDYFINRTGEGIVVIS